MRASAPCSLCPFQADDKAPLLSVAVPAQAGSVRLGQVRMILGPVAAAGSA